MRLVIIGTLLLALVVSTTVGVINLGNQTNNETGQSGVTTITSTNNLAAR